MSDEFQARPISEKDQWEDFLFSHPEANFLQSWYWGEFHQAIGNSVHRDGFYQAGKLKGVMLAVVERAKRGRYLTVPAGPIIDWQDSSLVQAFVDSVRGIAKQSDCVFVRVRPQLEDSLFARDVFTRHGFRAAPMHLHAELTLQLDITQSEDQLLSQMRKTTRNELKKAHDLGIKVTTSTDPLDIKEFHQLQIEAARRQRFTPFSYQFLEKQFKIFAENDQALLFKAFFKDKLLAQAIIIFYGQEAVYHHGVSTLEGRQYPGAYLIQWRAIKEAKRRAMTIYNLWGVAPLDDLRHRYYPLSIFKRGFGGREVGYLHAQDLVVDWPRYVLNYLVETIRKIGRRL